MSIPRLLLAPTHRTGLANAVAGALAEIVTAHGRKVRYHHLGPLTPAACWDRWEGTAFLDPDLYDEESLLRLYDVATRSAQLSFLSASHGVLDRPDGRPGGGPPTSPARSTARWCSSSIAGDGAPGVQALVAGVKANLSSLNLAGVLHVRGGGPRPLRGAQGRARRRGHPRRRAVSTKGTARAGTRPPRERGVCLSTRLCLEAVERQVDVGALLGPGRPARVPRLAEPADRPGQRRPPGDGRRRYRLHSVEPGFHRGAARRRCAHPPPRSGGGRGLARGGGGIGPRRHRLALQPDRHRDEPVAACGHAHAHRRRPAHTGSGRRIPGSPQPGAGLAGQDGGPRRGACREKARSSGTWRTRPMSTCRPCATTRCWREGQRATGWVLTDVDVPDPAPTWDPPLVLSSAAEPPEEQPEGAATRSLLCSRALIHLSGAPGIAARFVQECAVYASGRFW